MAVITPTHISGGALGRGALEVWYGTSAVNQSDTLTSGNAADAVKGVYRVVMCTLTWGSAVTKTCTVKIDSALGAAYDCLIDTLSTTAAVSDTFIPTGDLLLLPGDAILMTNAASGEGATAAAMAIYLEKL